MNECPKCGSDKIIPGFGLMGGGYGPYDACEDCGWFHKTQLCPICEGELDDKGACKEDGTAQQIRLKLQGPPRCGGCMRDLGPITIDGKCAHICGDGEQCGYKLNIVIVEEPDLNNLSRVIEDDGDIKAELEAFLTKYEIPSD